MHRRPHHVMTSSVFKMTWLSGLKRSKALNQDPYGLHRRPWQTCWGICVRFPHALAIHNHVMSVVSWSLLVRHSRGTQHHALCCDIDRLCIENANECVKWFHQSSNPKANQLRPKPSCGHRARHVNPHPPTLSPKKHITRNVLMYTTKASRSQTRVKLQQTELDGGDENVNLQSALGRSGPQPVSPPSMGISSCQAARASSPSGKEQTSMPGVICLSCAEELSTLVHGTDLALKILAIAQECFLFCESVTKGQCVRGLSSS
eukprot:5112888-Amphidinium_carterae.2